MEDHPEPSAGAFDPAETLRAIRDQTDRARQATEPDGRLLFGAWGIAWLVGYLAMWSGAQETGAPATWSGWVLAGCILGAMAFTIVHTTTRTVGLRGASSRAGARYGWTWFLGFTAYGVVLGAMGDAGASPAVVATAANGFACLIVGLMYIAGSLLFCENRMYVVGTWMLVTGAAAAFAGMPHTYLVMALAGGGGFLVMVVVEQVVRSRRRSLATHASPATGGGPRG